MIDLKMLLRGSCVAWWVKNPMLLLYPVDPGPRTSDAMGVAKKGEKKASESSLR